MQVWIKVRGVRSGCIIGDAGIVIRGVGMLGARGGWIGC